MAIPINIKELFSQEIVEGSRIEYKKGWNPQSILESICAFANDIDELSGGYIVIGAEEVNGLPVARGIEKSAIDDYYKALLNLGKTCLRPAYVPEAEAQEYQGKICLVIRVSTGEQRPYEAQIPLKGKHSKWRCYIRSNSSDIQAQADQKRRLYEQSSKLSFDDRIQKQSDVTDLDFNLLLSFLKEIRSPLFDLYNASPRNEFLRKMGVVRGPEEDLKPLNVGLMFFNMNPKQWFKAAQINLVVFGDDVGDIHDERIFDGPVHIQLRSAFQYFKNDVIQTRVVKIPQQAEASRCVNYPFAAFEEALTNAVYHQNYENEEPIEVRIHTDYIEIISYTGALPPITNETFRDEHFSPRSYRNRRMGEFLKELRLTEKKATGLPKIRKSMRDNGSPDPRFDMDDARSYVRVRLDIHPSFLTNPQKNEGLKLKNEGLELSYQHKNEGFQQVNEGFPQGIDSYPQDNEVSQAWKEVLEKAPKFYSPELEPGTERRKDPTWSSIIIARTVEEMGLIDIVRMQEDRKFEYLERFRKLYEHHQHILSTKAQDRPLCEKKQLIKVFQQYRSVFKQDRVFLQNEQLIYYLYQNGGQQTPDIAEALDMSQSKLERYLRKLKTLNIVVYSGSKNDGGYFLSSSFLLQMESIDF